jgi:hypothetical protein
MRRTSQPRLTCWRGNLAATGATVGRALTTSSRFADEPVTACPVDDAGAGSREECDLRLETKAIPLLAASWIARAER